jgi:ribosome-binding protein aMBF1 (putative translation factor)
MSDIKPWQERMVDTGSDGTRTRDFCTQAEIDELRAKVKELTENGQSLSDALISSREEVADLRAKAKDTERLRELWLESTAKESELRTNLAQLLIEAREKRGLSLTVASAFLGISKGHLHDYESGKELNPTLKVLSAFVRVYGIDPSVLICTDAEAAITALEQHKEKPCPF